MTSQAAARSGGPARSLRARFVAPSGDATGGTGALGGRCGGNGIAGRWGWDGKPNIASAKNPKMDARMMMFNEYLDFLESILSDDVGIP